MNVAEIIDIVESIAPRIWAEAWDNVGLQVGSRNWPVDLIWVALDPDPRVIAAAVNAHVDLLVTHHPLIMEPLKTIDLDTPWGSAIGMALQHKLAVFSAHTNLDAAKGGMNDILAERLGIDNAIPFIPPANDNGENGPLPREVGIGRTGDLRRSGSLQEFGARIKNQLSISHVKMVGDPALKVEKVALCTGSGGSLVNQFIHSEAQVFITGDIKYHQAREVELSGKGLIDIGHFASEHIYIESMIQQLNKLIPQGKGHPRIEACPLESDPFDIL